MCLSRLVALLFLEREFGSPVIQGARPNEADVQSTGRTPRG